MKPHIPDWMNAMKRQEWVVPVARDGIVRAVSVLADDATEAKLIAEGVVDADGAEQWPLLAMPDPARPCSECGRPNPGHWRDSCGWQR